MPAACPAYGQPQAHTNSFQSYQAREKQIPTSQAHAYKNGGVFGSSNPTYPPPPYGWTSYPNQSQRRESTNHQHQSQHSSHQHQPQPQPPPQQQQSSQTFYSILGVPNNSTTQAIRQAYRELAKQYHPDKNPNGEEKFIQIKEAYEILSDDTSRREYDAKIKQQSQTQVPQQTHAPHNVPHYFPNFSAPRWQPVYNMNQQVPRANSRPSTPTHNRPNTPRQTRSSTPTPMRAYTPPPPTNPPTNGYPPRHRTPQRNSSISSQPQHTNSSSNIQPQSRSNPSTPRTSYNNSSHINSTNNISFTKQPSFTNSLFTPTTYPATKPTSRPVSPARPSSTASISSASLYSAVKPNNNSSHHPPPHPPNSTSLGTNQNTQSETIAPRQVNNHTSENFPLRPVTTPPLTPERSPIKTLTPQSKNLINDSSIIENLSPIVDQQSPLMSPHVGVELEIEDTLPNNSVVDDSVQTNLPLTIHEAQQPADDSTLTSPTAWTDRFRSLFNRFQKKTRKLSKSRHSK